MLSIPNSRHETRSTGSRRQPSAAKSHCSAAAVGETCGEEKAFPAAQYEKTYQPTVFTGMNVEVFYGLTLFGYLSSLSIRSPEYPPIIT